jgi:hypothetical protein
MYYYKCNVQKIKINIMAKFDYRKWVIENKHGKKPLNEDERRFISQTRDPQTPSPSVTCGTFFPGECHKWKECINGSASGPSLVFYSVQGTTPVDYWNMFGQPQQGDAILTDTGVKLVYDGLGGDSIDMDQFIFMYGSNPTSATSTQCDFGWRCYRKRYPSDVGYLQEWAPHNICVPGNAQNPGNFATKNDCIDSGCEGIRADRDKEIGFDTGISPHMGGPDIPYDDDLADTPG